MRSAFLSFGLAWILALGGCPGESEFTPRDLALEIDLSQSTFYGCDMVDILFVIDNSNTMLEEQGNLINNFPQFIQRIEAIEPPIKSYHLGVISTDLGAGSIDISTCKGGGDEGRLQHTAVGEGCSGSFPKYLEGPGETVAQNFSCIAQLGTEGCGYEQPLEAALKALTDQSYTEGFMRKNAPLAIIFITDEDDCSTADPGLFNPEDSTLGGLPTRCVAHPDKLHPVSRYIEAFRALKDNPDRLVIAAITGPSGEVKYDPDQTSKPPLPICSSLDFGDAEPGNRFAELIEAFGDHGEQASLCDGDLSPALEIIGQAIERTCLK